mmetsp:Transcript_18748/g.58744  ORF Transcript_18748/g.58744 Transcript_18748/m.58744 type:complete len:276 (-) Transcript_18748:110-937(-)
MHGAAEMTPACGLGGGAGAGVADAGGGATAGWSSGGAAGRRSIGTTAGWKNMGTIMGWISTGAMPGGKAMGVGTGPSSMGAAAGGLGSVGGGGGGGPGVGTSVWWASCEGGPDLHSSAWRPSCAAGAGWNVLGTSDCSLSCAVSAGEGVNSAFRAGGGPFTGIWPVFGEGCGLFGAMTPCVERCGAEALTQSGPGMSGAPPPMPAVVASAVSPAAVSWPGPAPASKLLPGSTNPPSAAAPASRSESASSCEVVGRRQGGSGLCPAMLSGPPDAAA